MIDNELIRGGVYIPPSYRGNALSLESRAIEEECEKEPPCEKKTERKGPLLSGLCSGEDGWLWVAVVVLAVFLVCRESDSGRGRSFDDPLLYLGILLLLT